MNFIQLILLLVFWYALPTLATEFPITVLSVRDGDTITADIHTGLDNLVFHKQKIRLADIDCWETSKRRAAVKVTPAEIEKGKQAKADLEKLLSSAMVVTAEPSSTGRDVYGRRLMVLRCDGQLVSDYLRERGHARK
jgi:endonuclease YncB( thermonuclease family)